MTERQSEAPAAPLAPVSPTQQGPAGQPAQPDQPAPAPSHWLDYPQNHRTLWIVFIAVLAATVLAEGIWPIHGHFAIEALPGFNALYGFIACALMIAVAKLLALFLKRPDDYYDSEARETKPGEDA